MIFDILCYKRLYEALEFYTKNGFEYLEVPWMVDKEYIDVTYNGPNSYDIKNKYLVGSAEQSFIEYFFKNDIKNGRYVTITPCFREDGEDEYHRHSFMKVELIDTLNISYDSINEIIQLCLEFFGKYTSNLEIIKNINEVDILNNGIEIGSYGVRTYKNLEWIYATGLAEPRFKKSLKI